MSMAMFAQIKALEARVAELERQYAELLARLLTEKKTLELPRKSA